ncbi:exodeoxyribonuclease III [Nitrosomonas oligotropha]|uniref:exodeoxyribonuclease III n=1 Tax=Nitrosomonas oligotropha TaxID=42354 RepID=UPI00136BBBF4|nr:exodeoxyribonuclease III [Nitrosomonas oligotropha]MXS82484.1 exodeoxyribonuclease III [Nitrosomonas oligotropha]
MQIITLNLNGIRAAAKKGFFPWLAQQTADVVCVQELKAQLPDLSAEMQAPDDYHGYFHCAEQKGYSGVGIYTRKKPDRVIEGVGVADIDIEGRYLQADFGNLSIVSLYLPSGSSGEHRQVAKFYFMEKFYPVLQSLMASGRELILCGDWNIAHKEIDLKNWRSNQKNSGFLPEERAWLTNVFDEIGFVDVFRRLNTEPDQYTWWSNRGQAWAKNVGWRIDYQIATPAIAQTARSTSIFKDERFSDHAPLIVDYDHLL